MFLSLSYIITLMCVYLNYKNLLMVLTPHFMVEMCLVVTLFMILLFCSRNQYITANFITFV